MICPSHFALDSSVVILFSLWITGWNTIGLRFPRSALIISRDGQEFHSVKPENAFINVCIS